MHDLGDMCATMHLWWPGDSFVEQTLSFHLYVSSRAGSELASCVWQVPFPAESSPTLSGACFDVIILTEFDLGILGPAFSPPHFWSLV